VVGYAQDWLTTRTEDSGSKQAASRVDPKRGLPAGAVGDIGARTARGKTPRQNTWRA
jgi:hypothetical protein